jgi:hypothetical protein
LRVEDYFQQGRRAWLRLHEKGGKRHEVPCPPRAGRIPGRLDPHRRYRRRQAFAGATSSPAIP